MWGDRCVFYTCREALNVMVDFACAGAVSTYTPHAEAVLDMLGTILQSLGL